MVKLKLFSRRLDGALLHTKEDLEVFKHFKVLKALGTGSFATVYQVQRKSDRLLYALKHIDIRAIEPSERNDLVNEIRLLASLNHPNLMKYYEAFVDRHQLFIITELMPHGDLGTLLEKRAEHDDLLPERQVWRFFLQMALGLQYLHHNHVLHRDLKPQNILLGEGGRLKIADLGISQMLDHVFTKTLMGTPHYMSPEMWRRQPYSYSADIWALGCILHEMCSLRPLFLAPSDREVRARVCSGAQGRIPPRYSLELWDAIRVMLTQDPAERPTIDEVLQMPAVQYRLGLLPPEDLALLDPCHPEEPRVMKMLRISSRFDNWDTLNDLLPPSNYPDGPGVVETLRMRRPNSCPELNKLLKRQEADVWEGACSSCKGGGPDLGPCGCGARRRTEGAAFFSAYNTSCPRLEVWEMQEAMRRQSIAVGQLLHHRRKEQDGEGGGSCLTADQALAMLRPRNSQEMEAGGAGVGSSWGVFPEGAGGLTLAMASAESLPTGQLWDSCTGAGGEGGERCAAIKRTRSSGDVLQRGAREGGGRGEGVGGRPSWVGLLSQEPGTFDASPLEFGGKGGGTSRRARAANDGKGDKGGGGGWVADGTPSSPQPLAAQLTLVQVREAGAPPAKGTSSSSGGRRGDADLGVSGGGVGGEPGAGGQGRSGWRQQGAGGRSLSLPSPGSDALEGEKKGEEKGRKGGKVRFRSRLKQLLWGELDAEMHQPVW